MNRDKSKIVETDNSTAKIVRETGLDKFYTIPSVVDTCISTVGTIYKWTDWSLIIEPSAGNGSFLLKIPTENKIGIDISPEHADIIKMDFFEYSPSTSPLNSISNILVIGNPPFGKVSSLAIKFFNHAAQFATVIAFIIPRTFRRISVQNKLDKWFHLRLDEETPIKPCSFSPSMNVKCCFQIWEKREVEREMVILPTTHSDWEFLPFGPTDEFGQPTPPPQGADFAIRAYGGKCGEIKKDDLIKLRPKSWHWIKCNIDIDLLISRIQQLDYSNSLNTARQNSLGKGELVKLYTDFCDSVR